GKPLTVKYVPVTGESRFPYVVDGKIDLECGNSTNTKARREKVTFSMPLYFSSAKLLVREGSGITKFSDLAGKTLAVENGSTGQQIAESRKAAMNTMKVVIAPSSDAGVVAVETKTADAFMTDDILLYAFKAQSKEKLEVAGAVMSIEPLAISFSKDDKELATIVDREFTKLTQSGQLRKLYKKWFQTTLPQRSYNLNVVPNQLTSEVLIRPSNYVADWTVF
ncbi:MAG: transporter substrate-binding domain-containing protein, partial [Propionivibrio sp.]|nr:transporter substrate-binding domain-containing protein [Propionivibrio sp.]